MTDYQPDEADVEAGDPCPWVSPNPDNWPCDGKDDGHTEHLHTEYGGGPISRTEIRWRSKIDPAPSDGGGHRYE